ncbi:MAG: right-handed parallel beta-helix repeat-containing protein, partial [Planctomycetota bacterium]
MNRKTNLKMLVLILVVVVTMTGVVWNIPTVYGQAQPDYPSDGAVIYGDFVVENIWTRLIFIPDASAIKHTGYFSVDYSEVAGRVQDANLGSPPYGQVPGWEYTYFAGNPQVPPADETLVRGAKYYWTVDETDALGNTLAGDVWEFIIQDFKASFPSPPNEAVFVETDVLLSWVPGFGVEEHDVYLGTNLNSVELAEYDSSFPPPEFVGTTEEPNIFVTGLASDTKYYWRVDEVSGRLPHPFDGGTYHKSDVWGFTTVPEGVGTIREDLWWNIAGDDVSDLLNDPRYPGNPDETRILTSFNSGVALGDDYGGQIHGWLHPVKSGNYTFWLCSDDSSELFLSTGPTPANKVRIAYINGWANPYDWYNQSGTNNPYQQSAPIPLVGGQKYYIMARWKEDFAGDHCMVAWQGPDQPQAPVYGSSFAVIKGNRLSPFVQLWAHDPDPCDGQISVESPVTLRWGPGDNADEHDVYVGTDKALVESRAPSVYKGRIDSNSYNLGHVFSGMIYYWAIDEVRNSGPSPVIWQGDVWSFTTLPAPIFVDDDASGANDGSSWADAYNSLQDGLARADFSVKPVEIRVAQGIYKPASPSPPGAPPLPLDRTATFQLINGVTINGGYAGYGEADPNARDIEAYETILSGDLADNDVEMIDPCDLLDELSRGENSYHVVTGSGTDSTAVLDGFTITAGNAKGSGYGGGIYCHSGIPTLTNCTFTRNSAKFFGGGIYYHGSSNPTLINCTFNENSAMSGGGICESTSSLILKKCLFSGNWAHSGGGMSSIIWSMSKLIQCTFSGNSAYRGGGIRTDESSPMITHWIFSGNSAHRGGVMENSGG